MDTKKPSRKQPNKKHCPFSPNELAALYAYQNANQIAEALTESGFSVSAGVVCRWLEAAGIARRRPNAAQIVPCPFSRTRLRELYAAEHKSQKEIAALALPRMPGRDKAVSQTVVTRWLREAGVVLRTAAHAQSLWAKEHPEENQRRIAGAVAAIVPAAWAERPCGWCGKTVRRRAYRMRKPPVFCNKSCANFWRYAPKGRPASEIVAKDSFHE